MSEIITHVPQGRELSQWTVDNEKTQADIRPENFSYGVYSGLIEDIGHKIDSVQKNDAIDEETRSVAVEILAKGTLGGQEIGLSYVNRNVYQERDQRQYIAKMMLNGDAGKETAGVIVENGVCGFHSTRSQALAGILENGALMAAGTLSEKGHTMVTGEHVYQGQSGQKSISFSNLAESRHSGLAYAGELGVRVRDIEAVKADMKTTIEKMESLIDESDIGKALKSAAARHNDAVTQLEQDPNSLFAELSKHEFPVMIGVNKEYIDESEDRRKQGHLLIGTSDLGEFRPSDAQIPLKALPVVAVPQEVIKPVTELFKMFGYHNTKIVPIEILLAA